MNGEGIGRLRFFVAGVARATGGKRFGAPVHGREKRLRSHGRPEGGQNGSLCRAVLLALLPCGCS